jgi:hypothetical protein
VQKKLVAPIGQLRADVGNTAIFNFFIVSFFFALKTPVVKSNLIPTD